MNPNSPTYSLPWLRLLFATAICVSTPVLFFAQIRLDIVPLTYGDTFIWETRSINNLGQVVGEIYREAENWQPTTVIWQRDEEAQLIYDGPFYSPKLINDNGAIIGARGYKRYEHDSAPAYHDGYVWSNENGYNYVSTAELHESEALPIVTPADLSNTGVAVGASAVFHPNGSYNRVTKGWVWSAVDGLVQIPAFNGDFGYEGTWPSAVNDHGVVVGTYGDNYTEEGSYAWGAFVFDSINGALALPEIDAAFFDGYWIQPHDINNGNIIAGTINYDYGFVYDLEKRTGTSFSGFARTSPYHGAAAEATSINSLGIVVGAAEDWERATGEQPLHTPIIWSSKHGIARLADYTTSPLQNLLPAGQDIQDTTFEMRSINNHGQILGSITYRPVPNAFLQIPFALFPVLTYSFEFQGNLQRPDGNLLVFAHSKQLDEGSLTPGHFGKVVVHESSVDAKTWHPLEHGVGGVEIVDTADELQIRVPEQPRIFIRSRLADRPAATD